MQLNTSSKALASNVGKLADKTEKRLKIYVEKAKNECYSLGLITVRSVFKAVFDDCYGTNYDLDSLMDSITLTQTEFILSISIQYDKFKWINTNDRDFNFNEDSNSNLVLFRTRQDDFDSMNRNRSLFIDRDGLDSGAKASSEAYKNAYDNMSNIDQRLLANTMIDINNANLKKANNGAIGMLAERPSYLVYKIAKQRAEQELEKIVKQVLRKYNLQEEIN